MADIEKVKKEWAGFLWRIAVDTDELQQLAKKQAEKLAKL